MQTPALSLPQYAPTHTLVITHVDQDDEEDNVHQSEIIIITI